ncbi:MAG TPA: SCE4755 family polysaccharide monooxygenase-like protein [Polyangiaceae bacterium]|jgi:hypothetical protein|nr:SCE4755 family polysaccharide monooxygenase-like protein [Polyangiaceae bacterium]
MRKFLSSIAAGIGLAASFASTASAHIRMLEPTARYDITGFDTGIKSCPCGLGSSNRTCNLAVDSSDPDRSTRVSRFEAGSTITLRFEEFVDHAGRFRVAFDPDGADMADFNDNILSDISDPAGTGGQVWEMQVKLPDTTCENCTLQLVQAMEVDVNTPIADPAPISSYYSCVDITLVAPGTLGDDPDAPDEAEPGAEEPVDDGAPVPENAPDEGEVGGTDMSGAAPSGGSATGDTGSTPLIPAGSGTPTDTGSSGTPAPAGEIAMNDGTQGTPAPNAGGVTTPPPVFMGSSTESSASSGGCALAATPSAGPLGLGALGLLAALGRLRRRERRGSR